VVSIAIYKVRRFEELEPQVEAGIGD